MMTGFQRTNDAKSTKLLACVADGLRRFKVFPRQPLLLFLWPRSQISSAKMPAVHL